MVIVFICMVAAAVSVFIFTIAGRKRAKHDKQAYTGTLIGKQTKAASGAFIYYNQYNLSAIERIKYISIASVVLLAIGYLFFQNIIISILLCGFSLFYPGMKRKSLIKKRKHILNMQFKDALYSLSSSLSAGRAVEGAFKAILGDMKILYPDENTFITNEFELINRKVENNDTIESALQEFAARADIDDITNFVDVFVICKNTGGNLIEVIKNTSNIINQKIEIRNEIDLMIAEQKYSQKILSIMPFWAFDTFNNQLT